MNIIDSNYKVPRIFLDRYINQLSSDTFCVLLRLFKLYQDNSIDGKRELLISFADFQKNVLFNIPQVEENRILSELNCFGFVTRFYKENVYELNVTKINEESRELYKSKIQVKKRRFWFRITHGQIVKEKQSIKFDVSSYVNNFISRYPEYLHIHLNKFFEGFVQYFLKEFSYVKLQNIGSVIQILVEEVDNDKLMDKICSIYNNNRRIYGRVHPQYIRAVIRNVKDNKIKPDWKKENLEKYKRQKEESEKKFGLEIALGKVGKNDVSYHAFIKLKDFEGLKKLYNLGITQLKELKRENEIFLNYEWLK